MKNQNIIDNIASKIDGCLSPPFLNMSSAKAKLCFWNLVQSIDTENLYNFVKYKIGPIRLKSDGKTVITLTFPRNDLH